MAGIPWKYHFLGKQKGVLCSLTYNPRPWGDCGTAVHVGNLHLLGPVCSSRPPECVVQPMVRAWFLCVLGKGSSLTTQHLFKPPWPGIPRGKPAENHGAQKAALALPKPSQADQVPWAPAEKHVSLLHSRHDLVPMVCPTFVYSYVLS